MNKTLIVIAGATGVGKTEVAYSLAKAFQTEIISADSRQIYKELEIGTSKPTLSMLETIPHHFINTKSITESYSAGKFGEEAEKKLNELFQKHEIIVMVGGSGLYIQSVCDGFDEMPEVEDNIREKWNTVYQERGLFFIQEYIRTHDFFYYNRVDLQNAQRLIRAAEIIDSTGIPFSTFRKQKKSAKTYSILKILLEREREELYNVINNRMDRMIEDGLFEEATNLYTFKQYPALQTVGYKEIFDFLDKRYDKNMAIQLLKQHSRNYAKRQITWFKRDAEFSSFHPANTKKIFEFIDSIVEKKRVLNIDR
ncbi:MAG: tRNA (adenosine(37)-N6)-dimethylallyltransferase MiaA [Chitinophagaceae bacterium]|nr:tRNA (adenosine(37)-N6)-dimethylallyltransferase MiaA [Chitinophagaceae bacterium]